MTWIWIRWPTWLKLLLSIPIALYLFSILVWLTIARPYQVGGRSMLPNYPDNEYLLTQIVRSGTKLQRGDVVVFHAPKASGCPVARGCDFLKRVVGLPGETIRIDNGSVFINGQKLEEKYLAASTQTLGGNFLNQELKLIPAGQYVILGDNRPESSDSRSWGFVPKENIIGRAWFCYANCPQ